MKHLELRQFLKIIVAGQPLCLLSIGGIIHLDLEVEYSLCLSLNVRLSLAQTFIDVCFSYFDVNLMLRQLLQEGH